MHRSRMGLTSACAPGETLACKVGQYIIVTRITVLGCRQRQTIERLIWCCAYITRVVSVRPLEIAMSNKSI